MTEEIIIDGVNVAGCEFYFEDNGVIAPDGTPERANLCASPERSCENSDSCYCNKDCYYKQLKRLEQENAELKAENERLKTQYNYYACGNCNGKEDYINLEKHHKGLRKQFEKYYQQTLDDEIQINELLQTLEEIKKIAKVAFIVCDDECGNANKFAEIQDKINEVLK